jgi:hypothetical protein
MSMSWEEIAEERMKEIRRLRGVVRKLEEEIKELKSSPASWGETPLESSFTLMDIADRLNVLGYEPSDGKCRIVDKYITENFDADIGVNWSAIDKAIIQCKDKL